MELEVSYIALDSESERIAFMESWLAPFGLDYRRTPGVSVPDSGEELRYDRRRRLARFGYDLTRSEVGCFLAHRKCWQHCALSGRPLLILESDVKPCGGTDFERLWTRLLSYRDRFDIVRLHGIFEHNEVVRRRLKELGAGFSLMQCLGDPMGAGAYIVSPQASMRLLEASSTFFQPVDVFLGSTWKHQLSLRTVKPYPFQTIDFGSVIGERTRPKQSWLERLRIESHRFQDDLRRVLYMPRDFFK